MLGGCASSINTSSLLPRLGDGQPAFTPVDVRTGAEFRKGYLSEAVNIQELILPLRLAQVPAKNKDKPGVVYCAHGTRAALAGFILRLAKFKTFFHLRGDLAGWRAEGLMFE
jgi:rhodanese-related sulfurtransferase